MSQTHDELTQQLLDKQSLAELVTTYCRAIDRRDYALLKSLYFDDAIEDRGQIFKGAGHGFVDWAAADSANYQVTVHRVFNMLFVVKGDYAEGEIYAEAYHRTAGEQAQEVIAAGRYLDRYERRGGRWGIVFRTSTLDRCEVKQLNLADYQQFVAGSEQGIPSVDDLSYKTLSLFPRSS